MQEEIWKDVKGYEGLYQISSFGRVKSLARIIVHKNGTKQPIRERILKTGLSRDGYHFVVLSKDGETKTKDVHVIVAIAFLSHKPDGHSNIVHHIDENKTNNSADNLQIILKRKHQSHHRTNNTTGEHNINLTSDGTFQVGFWFAEKTTHIGTYKTIEEAIIARDEKLAEVKAGTFVPRPKHIPSSKYCCVSWNKARQKWVVVVKREYIGYFEDEEEAHQAVLKQLKNIIEFKSQFGIS